jgi:hypothetical protein
MHEWLVIVDVLSLKKRIRLYMHSISKKRLLTSHRYHGAHTAFFK